MYGPTASEVEASAQTILSSVADKFGIRFTEVGTGGGCMALEARLESGHWIVATDEGLSSLWDRLIYEGVARANGDEFPQGWSVGIYPNSTAHGDDWWGGEDSVVDVVDYDAYGDGLAHVVGRALAEFVKLV